MLKKQVEMSRCSQHYFLFFSRFCWIQEDKIIPSSADYPYHTTAHLQRFPTAFFGSSLLFGENAHPEHSEKAPITRASISSLLICERFSRQSKAAFLSPFVIGVIEKHKVVFCPSPFDSFHKSVFSSVFSISSNFFH